MRPCISALAAVFCGWTLVFGIPAHAVTPPLQTQNTTLRQLVLKRPGFYIGSAVDYQALVSNPSYKAILQQQFNQLTPENAMKWGAIHQSPDTYNFTQADNLVEFAIQNKMRVRGHTLVWYKNIPDWVVKGNYNRDQLMAILKNHIQTVVSHFKGKVAEWDVVNEAIEPNGNGLRDCLWTQVIGPEYIALAFQWAHEADPDALLFYNDYNTEDLGPKSVTQYNLLKNLLLAHIPVNGVGLQMHQKTKIPYSISIMSGNMRRLSDLNLRIAVTEMDVSITEPVGEDYSTKLQKQASNYGNALSACLGNKACTSFTVWGFSDAYTWQPENQPAIYSASMQPKPAYQKLYDILYNYIDN